MYSVIIKKVPGSIEMTIAMYAYTYKAQNTCTHLLRGVVTTSAPLNSAMPNISPSSFSIALSTSDSNLSKGLLPIPSAQHIECLTEKLTHTLYNHTLNSNWRIWKGISSASLYVGQVSS